MAKRGHDLREAWMAKFNAYKAQYPELADHLYKMQHRQLPEGWDRDLPAFPPDPKGMAGRDASGKVLNAVAKNVPWLVGGSADLAPSTKLVSRSKRLVISLLKTTAGEIFISAFASMPWLPS
jgi:transketolase